MFRSLMTIIRELYLYLTKVMFMLKHSVKLRRYINLAGESNGKLPPRTCPGCSVPEPHRSRDWALVPASPASKAEY